MRGIREALNAAARRAGIGARLALRRAGRGVLRRARPATGIGARVGKGVGTGAAALALAVLAGAGAAAPARADRLDEIAAAGALRLGYRQDAPPFSYLDPQGRPAGLSVLLCREAAPGIARAAGEGEVALDWVAVTAADRFEALEQGRIDMLCGPTTQTLGRRERMDFSIPYFVDGAAVVFRKGGPERLGDLTDEPVGVLRATTTEAVAREALARRAPGARLVLFDSHVEGLEALQRGDVEAYLGDRSILLYQLGRMRPTVQPVIGRRALSREPYALALPLGESRLRLAVDRELSRLYASGAVHALIERALGRMETSPEIEAIFDVVFLPE